MSDEIKPDPVLTLPDMESVRDAIDRNLEKFWEKFKYPYEYSVRSTWLCDLIVEIKKLTGRGYVSNAEAKKLARERLGLSTLSDEENAREGDTLSLLIYNAQGYLRSDAAKVKDAAEAAEGWIRPTQEWLQKHLGERVEVLRVQGLGTVVVSEGKFYVRPFRTRQSVYAADTIKVRIQE